MNILMKMGLSILSLLAVESAFAIHPSALSGTWLHDGKPVSVRAGHNYNFIFCNEQNDCTDGVLHGGNNISVNRWNVTGRLNAPGNVIHWSNGTQWVRPSQPGIVINKNFRLHKLNGPWTHDGKPTTISVSPDAKQFTITNEVGRSDTGYFDKHRNLVLPTLNIIGHPNKHLNMIEWSNGTAWYKR